ncbi:MAG: hypothetical protein WCV72_04985 [Patescibacteria group bacterium]
MDSQKNFSEASEVCSGDAISNDGDYDDLPFAFNCTVPKKKCKHENQRSPRANWNKDRRRLKKSAHDQWLENSGDAGLMPLDSLIVLTHLPQYPFREMCPQTKQHAQKYRAVLEAILSGKKNPQKIVLAIEKLEKIKKNMVARKVASKKIKEINLKTEAAKKMLQPIHRLAYFNLKRARGLINTTKRKSKNYSGVTGKSAKRKSRKRRELPDFVRRTWKEVVAQTRVAINKYVDSRMPGLRVDSAS